MFTLGFDAIGRFVDLAIDATIGIATPSSDSFSKHSRFAAGTRNASILSFDEVLRPARRAPCDIEILAVGCNTFCVSTSRTNSTG